MNEPASPSSPSSPTSPNTNYGTKTPSGNSRIYNCKQCNRAFTREEHLTRHTLLTHNKLKPYTCGICQRPFSRRDLLLRHAKNLHKGSELAVSRIRKSYKRESSSSSSSKDYDASPTSAPASPGSPDDMPVSRRSIDNSDLMNARHLLPLPRVNLPEISHHDMLRHQDMMHRASMAHEPMFAQTQTSPIIPINRLLSNSAVPNGLGGNPAASISPHPYPTSSDTYDTPEKKRLKMSVNMLVS